MGRKVYTSGRSVSDRAPDRKESDADLSTYRQHIAGPVIDEQTKLLAVAGVRRRCEDAELILDALGLVVKPPKQSARMFDCPTCGAAPGAGCKDSNSTVMGRYHVARNKLLKAAGRIDNTEGITE